MIQKYSVLALVFVFSYLAEASTDWQMVKKKDGVTVYSKEIEGSPLMAFKGDGIVEAPIEKVASVIFDHKRSPEWVVDLDSTKILRWNNPNEFITYSHIKTPPIIMKDRDFVSKVQIEKDPTSKKLKFHYQAAEDPEAPVTDKYIRGQLISTTFVLTSIEDGQKTLIEGEIHCDPKGSVAKWIVNYFQRDWPIKMLVSMRRQVKKPDITIDSRFANLFSSR